MSQIKPTHKAIQAYYAALRTYAEQHAEHEGALRSAFLNPAAIANQPSAAARSQSGLLERALREGKGSDRRRRPPPANGAWREAARESGAQRVRARRVS